MLNKTTATNNISTRWLALSIAGIAMLLWFILISGPDKNLHVHILDVGQGDAILIQKGNKQVLVDGGPGPSAICLRLGEKIAPWDRNIELMILTHPSEDHIGGLIEVINRYNVKQVIYPDLEYSSITYEKWLELINEKELKHIIAQAGQRIDLGEGALIEVLNPQKQMIEGTDSYIDNNGIVLRLKMGEVSFLLMADTMWETELELIYNRILRQSTVIKVGHHGSDTSTTEKFLQLVDPQIAVISVGKNNEYGHPDETVLNRLQEHVDNIYRTDRDGSIEFITDGEKVWVRKGNRNSLWFN